eukprot:Gb_15530 [translate_table: standard]
MDVNGWINGGIVTTTPIEKLGVIFLKSTFRGCLLVSSASTQAFVVADWPWTEDFGCGCMEEEFWLSLPFPFEDSSCFCILGNVIMGKLGRDQDSALDYVDVILGLDRLLIFRPSYQRSIGLLVVFHPTELLPLLLDIFREPVAPIWSVISNDARLWSTHLGGPSASMQITTTIEGIGKGHPVICEYVQWCWLTTGTRHRRSINNDESIKEPNNPILKFAEHLNYNGETKDSQVCANSSDVMAYFMQGDWNLNRHRRHAYFGATLKTRHYYQPQNALNMRKLLVVLVHHNSLDDPERWKVSSEKGAPPWKLITPCQVSLSPDMDEPYCDSCDPQRPGQRSVWEGARKIMGIGENFYKAQGIRERNGMKALEDWGWGGGVHYGERGNSDTYNLHKNSLLSNEPNPLPPCRDRSLARPPFNESIVLRQCTRAARTCETWLSHPA